MTAGLSGRVAAPGISAHGRTQASCSSHISGFMTPRLTCGLSNAHVQQNLKACEEVNSMKPLYTLLLCLPAALALIACGCGMALLWPATARSADHPTVGRRHNGRHAA